MAGVLQEKEIRAYQFKNKELVCPVCATDEEKATRCQKKIK